MDIEQNERMQEFFLVLGDKLAPIKKIWWYSLLAAIVLVIPLYFSMKALFIHLMLGGYTGPQIVYTAAATTPLQVLDKQIFSLPDQGYAGYLKIENANLEWGVASQQYTVTFQTYGGTVLDTVNQTTFILPSSQKLIVIPRFTSSTKPDEIDVTLGATHFVHEPDLSLPYELQRTTVANNSTGLIVSAAFINQSAFTISEVDLPVAVYNSQNQIVAVNFTYINDVLSGETRTFQYSWPTSIPGAVRAEIDPEMDIFDPGVAVYAAAGAGGQQFQRAMKWFSNFRYFDLYLFASSTLLLILGLLMIYSTTLSSPTNLMSRQLVFAIIGFVGMFTLAFFDYRKLRKISGLIYVVIVLSLAFVWLLGSRVQGSTRWINLGFFQLQPAEFTKLIMVIIMAKFLDQSGEKLQSLRYVLLSAVYVGIPAILILIEPDLGSALVIFFTWLMMLLFSKMNKKHLLVLLFSVLVVFSASWVFVLKPYQKNRIYTFLNPSEDPQGRGYNVLQSIIAVGSGSVTGRGVGRGFQSQLKFLPERQTDFIFASTAEELGLLGSTFIIVMYAIICFRLIQTTRAARDNFGMYLTLGIFFMLLIQALINIGMNVGLLPVTGIPLPLVSYGGSSLLTTMLALGLVQSVVARQKAVRFGQLG